MFPPLTDIPGDMLNMPTEELVTTGGAPNITELVTCLTGDLNIADPPVTSPAPEVPPNKLSRVLLTGAELEYIPVCDGGARGSSGSSRLISFSVPSVAEK